MSLMKRYGMHSVSLAVLSGESSRVCQANACHGRLPTAACFRWRMLVRHPAHSPAPGCRLVLVTLLRWVEPYYHRAISTKSGVSRSSFTCNNGDIILVLGPGM